jgi:hypothetical protein
MRCFNTAASAREGDRRGLGMMWTANVLLACLLATAGFSDGARTPQQRREQSPYLVMPPGSSSEYSDGRGSRALGERSFVGGTKGMLGDSD